MDDSAAFALQQQDALAGLEETGRFEARSVTGALYTIVEHKVSDTAPRNARATWCKRYRTAWAGLNVAANDDGTFTIVSTHTRLVRTEAT